MNATASSRQRPKYDLPSAATAYLEGEIAGTLAGDAAFFKHHPKRHHRIRPASPSEIKAILERRPLEPTDSCQFVALVQRDADGRRRRVLVQAFEIDIEAVRDDEIASLFDNIIAFGWTWIGELP